MFHLYSLWTSFNAAIKPERPIEDEFLTGFRGRGRAWLLTFGSISNLSIGGEEQERNTYRYERFRKFTIPGHATIA